MDFAIFGIDLVNITAAKTLSYTLYHSRENYSSISRLVYVSGNTHMINVGISISPKYNLHIHDMG